MQRFSVALSEEMGGTCSSYGIGEAYTRFWWGNLRERNHLGDPGVDARIILRQLQEVACAVWTGSSCLRIGTGGGQL